MNDTARTSVEEAAKILQVARQTVRVMLQRDIVDWGSCFKMPNSHRYSYIISRKKFNQAFGIGGGRDD